MNAILLVDEFVEERAYLNILILFIAYYTKQKITPHLIFNYIYTDFSGAWKHSIYIVYAQLMFTLLCVALLFICAGNWGVTDKSWWHNTIYYGFRIPINWSLLYFFTNNVISTLFNRIALQFHGKNNKYLYEETAHVIVILHLTQTTKLLLSMVKCNQNSIFYFYNCFK